MKCPKCEFENPTDSKFCLKCGNILAVKCPQYSKTLPVEAEFCYECAHDLTIKETVSFDYSKCQSYIPKYLRNKIITICSVGERKRKLLKMFFAEVTEFIGMSKELDYLTPIRRNVTNEWS